MNKSFLLASTFILLFISAWSQEWSLKLKSTVELRTWKLTTTADKTEKSIQGATILLLDGTSTIKEVMSDLDGNFEIEIPSDGDYYLSVSYPGCNTKKFYVSTKGNANEDNKKDFKPSIRIGGFMMSKPIKGVDYLGLQEPLLKVEYKNKTEGFDKDEAVSNKGVSIVSNIMDAENVIIEKFCNNNKLGDEALNKKNYAIAKNYYLKALDLIPGEEYPKLKLVKAEAGIKEEEAKKDAIAEEQAAKVEASKLANQKAIEEKQAAEKALFDKAAAERKEKEMQKKETVANKSTPTPTTTPLNTTSNTTQNTTPNAITNTTSNTPVATEAVATNEYRGKSKHKVAHTIGSHTYKSNIERGNAQFKAKAYAEAKKSYAAALKYKEGDAYAKGKIEEINALIHTK